ncbi:BASS family bile acid:Na+ symporter [Methanolinea mesophila]|uniref:bile acid:sodium symporter family protein n=1 Tax=Methanolinea mesophila TaxID=547055 RepID=UPI001AE359A6|nr:bile acid:sodium symporter [Methanolinea mesophila]MBP1929182.1 BASS family bile acid:Na+ symporter [Methanolinea mesophila]
MITQTILMVAIYLFIITSLLFIGLDHTYRDILAPLKDIRLVIIALLVNLVLVPLTGYILVTVFALSGAVLIGCILMTSAPGASYSPRLAEVSAGNVPFATGLMFLLCTTALVSTPVTLLIVLPESTMMNVWPVIRSLIFLMVIPLIVGLALRAYRPTVADRLKGPVVLFSYVMILFVLILALATTFGPANPVGIFRGLFGSYGVLVIILAVAISFLFGFLLGGPNPGIRRSLAESSAIRNSGMALLFAASSFTAIMSDILTVLIAYTIIQTVIVGIVAGLWRRKSGLIPTDDTAKAGS